MALFLQHKTDDIQWAVWKMEESLDALLALLPDARRVFCEQELNRFVSERRKMEWLSVRVLLYAMLQEDKEIGYSPEGKPYLTDHSFFISISRAKCSISEKSRTFFSRFFAANAVLNCNVIRASPSIGFRQYFNASRICSSDWLK